MRPRCRVFEADVEQSVLSWNDETGATRRATAGSCLATSVLATRHACWVADALGDARCDACPGCHNYCRPERYYIGTTPDSTARGNNYIGAMTIAGHNCIGP